MINDTTQYIEHVEELDFLYESHMLSLELTRCYNALCDLEIIDPDSVLSNIDFVVNECHYKSSEKYKYKHNKYDIENWFTRSRPLLLIRMPYCLMRLFEITGKKRGKVILRWKYINYPISKCLSIEKPNVICLDYGDYIGNYMGGLLHLSQKKIFFEYPLIHGPIDSYL